MRSQRGQLLIAAVVAVIGVLTLWAGPADGAGRAETDTVHYAQRAYELAGYDHATATAKAVHFVCDDKADYTNKPRDVCEADLYGVLGFPPQYQAIFQARPGFPALMSLFIRVFGDGGIYLTVLLLQIATGLLLVVTARALGLPGWWPLAAEAAYFLLPSGFVGTRVLSEAASAPGLVALLYAVALIVQEKRRKAAIAIAVAAYAWLFAVRAVDASLAAAFLLLAGLAALAVRKTGGLPWAKTLTITSLVSLAVLIVVGAALSWPTVNQGVEDTMTDHFTRPVTSDMYERFLSVEVRFWRAFATQISTGAYLVVLAALGIWGVAKRGWTATPFLAVAAIGGASLLLHPGDWARMLAPMWIVVSLGLPLLAARRRPEAGPEPEPLRPAQAGVGEQSCSPTVNP